MQKGIHETQTLKVGKTKLATHKINR